MAAITILIPNWNGGTRLTRTLESVRAQRGVETRTLVIDNGSTDGSPETAADMDAEVLWLDRNTGFAHAVNQGVRAASTEWVMVLNNDALLNDGCLSTLLSSAEDCGAPYATPRIVTLTDPNRLDGTFDLIARSGCAWRAGHGTGDGAEYRHAARVALIPMTAALIRRDVFTEAGPLEERFESYLEDVDFFLRCALRGMRGLYEPAAVARHEGSATLGAWSPRMVELIARNQVWLIARHWPDEWVMQYGRHVFAGQLLWGLAAWRRGRGWAWIKGKWAGLERYTEFRNEGRQPSVESFDDVVAASERTLRELQAHDGAERFWSTYFRCVGAGRI